MIRPDPDPQHCYITFLLLSSALPGECSGLAEPDGVEEDLGDEGKLGRGHRHRPEQQLQIIRQLLQLVGKIVHRGLCIARPTKHSLPLTKLTTLSSEWTVG